MADVTSFTSVSQGLKMKDPFLVALASSKQGARPREQGPLLLASIALEVLGDREFGSDAAKAELFRRLFAASSN